MSVSGFLCTGRAPCARSSRKRFFWASNSSLMRCVSTRASFRIFSAEAYFLLIRNVATLDLVGQYTLLVELRLHRRASCAHRSGRRCAAWARAIACAADSSDLARAASISSSLAYASSKRFVATPLRQLFVFIFQPLFRFIGPRAEFILGQRARDDAAQRAIAIQFAHVGIGALLRQDGRRKKSCR